MSLSFIWSVSAYQRRKLPAVLGRLVRGMAELKASRLCSALKKVLDQFVEGVSLDQMRATSQLPRGRSRNIMHMEHVRPVDFKPPKRDPCFLMFQESRKQAANVMGIVSVLSGHCKQWAKHAQSVAPSQSRQNDLLLPPQRILG